MNNELQLSLQTEWVKLYHKGIRYRFKYAMADFTRVLNGEMPKHVNLDKAQELINTITNFNNEI